MTDNINCHMSIPMGNIHGDPNSDNAIAEYVNTNVDRRDLNFEWKFLDVVNFSYEGNSLIATIRRNNVFILIVEIIAHFLAEPFQPQQNMISGFGGQVTLRMRTLLAIIEDAYANHVAEVKSFSGPTPFSFRMGAHLRETSYLWMSFLRMPYQDYNIIKKILFRN